MAQETHDISTRLLVIMEEHRRMTESIAMSHDKLPKPIRRLIAEYANTVVRSCDLLNCNEFIWISILDRTDGRRPHFIEPRAYNTAFCEGKQSTLYTSLSSQCVKFANKNHLNMNWDKHNEVCPFQLSLLKPVHLRGNGTFPDGPLSDFL